jgi:tetratricopeptide (TPR) repeat protein
MNEEPKNIWRTLWKQPQGFFQWFGLLIAASIVVALAVITYRSMVYGESFMEPLLPALDIAVFLALLIMLMVTSVRWLYRWRDQQRRRQLLFAFACLVTFVALFYAVENWRGKWAWETHKSQWEAKGEKFTMAQLAPPPVPDEQNFAMTPLFKPLFDYKHNEALKRGAPFTFLVDDLVWRDTNGMARLEQTQAERSDGRTTNDHLSLGALEKGAFADLAACQEFYRGNTNYPQPATSGTAAADILFALGKFDPEIKELSEAVATRAYSRFPMEYDREPSWTIPLPHLARVKAICRLTHMRAVARLELGQSSEAFEELKLALRLSESLRDETLLIDQLVRVAVMQFNLQTLREGLLRHAWNDAQLAELEQHLAKINLLAGYKLAMRGERASTIEGLDWMRRQGFKINPLQMFDALMTMVNEPRKSNPLGYAIPSGWFYQSMLTISKMHQELIFPAVDEQAHRVFPDKAEQAEIGANLLIIRPRPNNLFARKLMPALSSSCKRVARGQAFVDAARLACALERYRLAIEKLPETLEALTPRFIESIPIDVIAGEPLRYQVKPDGGYVLYSVGWNKADDGGEIGWSKSPESKVPRVDITQGDWVWLMPNK